MKFINFLKKHWYIPVGVFMVSIMAIASIVKNSENKKLPSFKDPVSDTVVKVKSVNKTELYEKEIKDSKEYKPKEQTKDEIIKMTWTNLDNNKENTETNKQETKEQSTTNTNKTIGEKQNSTSKAKTETKNYTAYNYNQNNNNQNSLNSYSQKNKKEETNTKKNEEIKKDQGEKKEEKKQDLDPFGTIRSNDTKEKNQSVSNKEEKTVVGNSNDYIRAEIYGDQTIEDHGGIILRLKQTISYNGQKIPTNSLLYGKVAYSGNRALVFIHMCKTPTGNINIKMELFDTDYIEGIYSKTALDKGIDKTKEDAADNVTDNNTLKGQFINKTVKTITKAVTNQQSATVKLEDGYVIFIKFVLK